MKDNFSKFGLTTGMVAIGKKLPVITLPAKKSITKNISIINNSWIMGIILILSTVFLLITLAISVKQARHHTTQPELVAQLQMQHLRLSKAAQQAHMGNADAFTQLQDSQYHLNQYITLLSQGGVYRQDKTVPAADHSLSLSLDAYHQFWQHEDKKLALILNHKESSIKLNSSIQAIHITHSQLARRIEELISRMVEIGNLSQEIRTMESIKMHARSAARNVRTLFPNEFSLTEITTQIAQDHAQISAIIQILSQKNRY